MPVQIACRVYIHDCNKYASMTYHEDHDPFTIHGEDIPVNSIGM